MHALENLEKKLKKDFPKAKYLLDLPTHPHGSAFLDINFDGYALVVEWRKEEGFGLSSPPGGGLGHGPDEVFKAEAEAVRRVSSLLQSRQPTIPEREISLQELRTRLHTTQEMLAAKMGVTQANVSKIEKGEDPQIGTLRNIVEGLGGTLKIIAQFKEGTVLLGLGASLGKSVGKPNRRKVKV